MDQSGKSMVVQTGWWDIHSENVREMAKEKVSRLIANRLIFEENASPLGDANKIKALLRNCRQSNGSIRQIYGKDAPGCHWTAPLRDGCSCPR